MPGSLNCTSHPCAFDFLVIRYAVPPAVLSHVFINMLELGVTIVTGMDRKAKVYSNESVVNNPMDLMYSIMLFASYKLIYTLAL